MKKFTGFTLAEVLIAVFILTSSVFVLTELQIRSMFRMLKDKDLVERIFLIKRDLYTVFITLPKKENKEVKNQIEEPEITIISEMKEIDKTANYLRARGISVSVDFTGRKIGVQIKTAVKQGIPYVICIGDDEVKSGKLSFKDLSSGKERKMSMKEIGDQLAEML